MKIRDKVIGVLCGKTKEGTTKNGKKWFTFNLAVYDPFKKDNVFWNCSAFGKVAEIIMDRYGDKEIAMLDVTVEKEQWKGEDGKVVTMPKLIVAAADMVEWRIKKKLSGYQEEYRAKNESDIGNSGEGEGEDDDLPF